MLVALRVAAVDAGDVDRRLRPTTARVVADDELAVGDREPAPDLGHHQVAGRERDVRVGRVEGVGARGRDGAGVESGCVAIGVLLEVRNVCSRNYSRDSCERKELFPAAVDWRHGDHRQWLDQAEMARLAGADPDDDRPAGDPRQRAPGRARPVARRLRGARAPLGGARPIAAHDRPRGEAAPLAERHHPPDRRARAEPGSSNAGSARPTGAARTRCSPTPG